MKCSYCNEIADFKCACQQPFMCPFHLGIHQKTRKNHPYENIDEELGDLRLGLLRSKLMKRIQKINIAQNELAKNSEYLIKSIEKACEQVWDNLDAVKSTYFELLKRIKFCDSELQIIEKIESLDINVKTIAVDEITTLVQNTYSKDLITFEKIDELSLLRSNGYLEMTLKQRIDLMKTKFDIIDNDDDLNRCHEIGKEVLVSNDGKYLFFCKLYLGMIQKRLYLTKRLGR